MCQENNCNYRSSYWWCTFALPYFRIERGPEEEKQWCYEMTNVEKQKLAIMLTSAVENKTASIYYKGRNVRFCLESAKVEYAN